MKSYVAENLISISFDEETLFERCNLTRCTFNTRCHFDRCNIIECVNTNNCICTSSNIIEHDYDDSVFAELNDDD